MVFQFKYQYPQAHFWPPSTERPLSILRTKWYCTGRTRQGLKRSFWQTLDEYSQETSQCWDSSWSLKQRTQRLSCTRTGCSSHPWVVLALAQAPLGYKDLAPHQLRWESSDTLETHPREADDPQWKGRYGLLQHQLLRALLSGPVWTLSYCSLGLYLEWRIPYSKDAQPTVSLLFFQYLTYQQEADLHLVERAYAQCKLQDQESRRSSGYPWFWIPSRRLWVLDQSCWWNLVFQFFQVMVGLAPGLGCLGRFCWCSRWPSSIHCSGDGS